MRTFLCDLNHFFWFAKKMCVIFFWENCWYKISKWNSFPKNVWHFFGCLCLVFAFYVFIFWTFFCFFTLFYALFKFFYFLRILLRFRIFQLFTHFFTFYAFVCFFGFINMMNLAESMHFRSMNRTLNRQMCTDCIQMLFYKCSFIQPFNFPQTNG